MNQHIALIGATSAIAEQIARLYAMRGQRLTLLARNREANERIAADLRVRGASRVDTLSLDLQQREKWAASLDSLFADSPPDIVILCAGTLPDQARAWTDIDYLHAHFTLNASAQIELLTLLAARMQSGSLVAVSSVAGDRGRSVNGCYGAAKAALTAYTSALRQSRPDLHVLTVKPGIVISPMTADIEHGALSAEPELVARQIETAIRKRRLVLYTPRRWQLIMLIIRHIPEFIFRGLKF